MAKQRLVITGVTSGIGLAMSEQFIKMGHTVAGCGRNREMIEKLRSKHAGDGHLFSVVDVSKKDNIEGFAAEVLKTIGVPTFLLNNASIVADPCNLWELSFEKFSSVIDINLKGVFHMTKQFIPAMIKQGQGVVVNFSSEWGRSPGKGQGSYCSSKFGVEGMSKCLALDLPPPLTCVPLNPGLINTPMLVAAMGRDIAERCRNPDQWADQVCPFILNIDRGSNGESLTAPGNIW